MTKHRKKRVVTVRLNHSALRQCKDCPLIQRIDQFPLRNVQLGRRYYKHRCAQCEYRYWLQYRKRTVTPRMGGPVNFNQLLAAFRPERKA